MEKNKKRLSKVKEPIRLRAKKLSNGNQSLYLDFYFEGKREYEFLKLYLVPETSAVNRETNRETLKLANAIKAQKIVELQNNRHGFSIGSMRLKVGLIDYVEMFAERKKEAANGEFRGSYQTYKALQFHLKQYGGESTTFKQIDRHFCQGFIDYLKTAQNVLNGKPLSENTQAGYMKKFEAVLNSAIADEVIQSNPFRQIKPEDKPRKRNAAVCYLTIEEVNRLVNTPCLHANIKHGFLFSCFSGLRFSDVKGLTWGKLQRDNTGKTFINYVQKKTKKQEYLPVSREALKYLPARDGATDSDLVFRFPSGGYVNLNCVNGLSQRV